MEEGGRAMSRRRGRASCSRPARARRFGGAKQLAELDGRPLLEHARRRAVPRAGARPRRRRARRARRARSAPRVDLRGAEVVVCAGLGGGPGGLAARGVAALGDVDVGRRHARRPAAHRRARRSRAVADAARARADGGRAGDLRRAPGPPGRARAAHRSRASAALRGDVGARAAARRGGGAGPSSAARLGCDPTRRRHPRQLEALGP